jgi:hypothetical protein
MPCERLGVRCMITAARNMCLGKVCVYRKLDLMHVCLGKVCVYRKLDLMHVGLLKEQLVFIAPVNVETRRTSR